jgi:hypothetical protein
MDEDNSTNIRFQFWETGGAFIKKFPYYTQNLVKNAKMTLYVFSAEDLLSSEEIVNHVTHTRKVWK